MNRLLFMALIAVVGVGIVAGLMAVGGPGYARMEKNDNQRMADLRVLGQYYACLHNTPEAARDDGTPAVRCRGFEAKPDTVDPVTGAEYPYSPPQDGRFSICATFQTDTEKDSTRFLEFEGQVGCVVYRKHKNFWTTY